MKATDTHIGRTEGKQIRTDNGNLVCEAFTDPDTGNVHVYIYAQNGVCIVPHIQGRIIPSKCGDGDLVE